LKVKRKDEVEKMMQE